MSKEIIGLAGEGWGAVAAVKGLKRGFTVHCCSSDLNVTSLLDEDDKTYDSIANIPSKTVLLAGYLKIISAEALKKKTFINIHYSLLPAYRGLHALAWAILNNEKKLGFSVHLVDNEIDNGEVIFQKAFKNDGESSLTAITEVFNNYVEQHLAVVVQDYLQGKITPQKQDYSKATWVGKRGAAHNRIKFDKDLVFYKNLFRVLQSPYPKPTLSYKGKILRVLAYSLQERAVEADCGRILNRNSEGIWVHVKGGYLVFSSLIDDRNKIIDINSFALGEYFDD